MLSITFYLDHKVDTMTFPLSYNLDMLGQKMTVVKHFEKCVKSCGIFLRSEDTEDTFGNRSKSGSEDEFKIFVLSYLDSRHNKASKKTTFILPWGGCM